MANDKYLFVVSGAAGTGKDSVVKALACGAHRRSSRKRWPTVRRWQEGVDYYHRTREQTQQLIEKYLWSTTSRRGPVPARTTARHPEKD